MVNVDRNFAKIVLKDNGADYEKTVAIEEMSELIKAITKTQRYPDIVKYWDCVTEEMADCYICLRTLQTIFDVKDIDMQDAINRKIQRYKALKSAEKVDDFIEE